MENNLSDMSIRENLIKMYSSNKNLIKPLKLNNSIQIIAFVLIFFIPILSGQIGAPYGHSILLSLELFSWASVAIGSVLLFSTDSKVVKKTGFAPFLYTVVTTVLAILIYNIGNFSDGNLVPSLVPQIIILFYLLVVHRKEYVGSIRLVFSSAKKIQWLVIIVLLGLLVSLVLSFFGEWISDELTKTLPAKIQNEMKGGSVNQQSLESGLGSFGSYLTMFLFSIGTAPLIEEIVFRKGVFDVVRNKKIALVLSALIFATLHIHTGSSQGWYDYVNIFSYLSAGIALGVVYYYTENFAITWFIHMLINIIAFMLIVLK